MYTLDDFMAALKEDAKENEAIENGTYKQYCAENGILYKKTCPRCSGTGYLNQFNYVSGGVCFKCNGKGRV